jgi:hypothetical protein
VTINKTLPAAIYDPDLVGEPSGIYHEDHEIDGVMYRAANAAYVETLLPPQWQQQDTSQPSFAAAQNTDGSISYFSMPASTTTNWTTWEGSPNNAVYNAVYNAVDYGLSTTGSGADNTAFLQAAVVAAINAGGGTLSPARPLKRASTATSSVSS